MIKCFICGGNHYQSDCPQKPTSPTQATSKATTDQNEDDQTTPTERTTSVDQPAGKVITGTENVTTDNDNDEWDQYVDYSGLSFTHVGSSSASKASSSVTDIDSPRTVLHKHLLN